MSRKAQNTGSIQNIVSKFNDEEISQRNVCCFFSRIIIVIIVKALFELRQKFFFFGMSGI